MSVFGDASQGCGDSTPCFAVNQVLPLTSEQYQKKNVYFEALSSWHKYARTLFSGADKTASKKGSNLTAQSGDAFFRRRVIEHFNKDRKDGN